MSRDICFRAWHESRKAWLHSGKAPSGGCHILGECILHGGWMHGVPLRELDDVVVEQFTGLKDREGVHVWEGDLVSTVSDTALYVVRFERGGFMPTHFLHDGSVLFNGWDLGWCATVVGNVHENPEMLAKVRVVTPEDTARMAQRMIY